MVKWDVISVCVIISVDIWTTCWSGGHYSWHYLSTLVSSLSVAFYNTISCLQRGTVWIPAWWTHCFLSMTHHVGSTESDGANERGHASERRPEHAPPWKRLFRRHPPETGGADSQHRAQHPLQVSLCNIRITFFFFFVAINKRSAFFSCHHCTPYCYAKRCSILVDLFKNDHHNLSCLVHAQ